MVIPIPPVPVGSGLTIPRGKYWPDVQEVAIGGGSSVPVVNPLNDSTFPPMPIPLIVHVDNTSSGSAVTPEVPNFPSVNRFAGAIPGDGSPVDLLLQKGASLSPCWFRDVSASGDVLEFCGGFLPLMRIYFYNPYNAFEVVFTVTEQLVANSQVVFEASGSYAGGYVNNGMIELLSSIHLPSYDLGNIRHTFRLEAHVVGGHALPAYDIEAVLCSHYDLAGTLP